MVFGKAMAAMALLALTLTLTGSAKCFEARVDVAVKANEIDDR
jgi:hypothetical protein